MRIKLVLSNGSEHIVEAESQEEFICRFTNEDGNIIKDVLLIKNGVYINPRNIVKMEAVLEIPKHKKFHITRWLKGWLMINILLLILAAIGRLTKNVLILFAPLELISSIIWFITVGIMFARHVKRLKIEYEID